MSTEGPAGIAKKACTRCSKSKKRCDRALPRCGLCARLGRRCEYKVHEASDLDPSLAHSPGSETIFDSRLVTPSHLKNTLVHRLEPFAPGSVVSVYHQAIEPWFPIASTLQSRLRPTWDETPLDVATLCLAILLLTTSPSPTASSEGAPSELESFYLQTKSSIALAEGLGLNSVPIVQSRILTTLFEVGHGFYPAAYISIGAAVRAADALEYHPNENSLHTYLSDVPVSQEETVLIWCGVLVLDRYIAAESGPRPPLTRSRTASLHRFLKSSLCPTSKPDLDKNGPAARFSRIVEASVMLDNIHTTTHSPTSEETFNMEEVMLTVEASTSLQTLLIEETAAEDHLYSGAMSICQAALLQAFQNGTRTPFSPNATENWSSTATKSLTYILSSTASTVEPFTMGMRSIDFNYFSPFAAFLVYNVALVTTDRLSKGLDANDGLARLRTLRKFLKIVSQRWLCGERYLKLLDEDTTPRLLKTIKQG